MSKCVTKATAEASCPIALDAQPLMQTGAIRRLRPSPQSRGIQLQRQGWITQRVSMHFSLLLRRR